MAPEKQNGLKRLHKLPRHPARVWRSAWAIR